MNRTILKPYEVDAIQRMKESILKKPLLKARTGFMVEQGMTLIEIMVALAVLAVLVSLAAPSFVAITKNNRATAVTNDLIASFQLARTEAIKRNGTVSVQSTNDVINWGGGYRIFVDLNGDGKLDAGELLLRNVDAPHTSVTLISTRSDISYQGDGGVVNAATFTINTPCGSDDTGVTHKKRVVQLGKSGSHTLTHVSEACP